MTEYRNQRRTGIRRKTISVDLDSELHRRLKQVAHGKGLSMSRYIAEIMEGILYD